ncbi:SPX domain-containing protein 1 isoform X1 [Eucalyptus grandis]|uniref:SPX domain-containing protein 1 isoform X1 n=1 Tax=Eucalyptus grandis TaxID=71139 RepID=UPI00192E841F|nr:SPX domain-containing protein 1 isoform X1 [Eucalyptus grandis]
MKFGKSLSNQIEETLPEWREKFLSYKDLKKKLKLIEPKGADRPAKRPRLDAAEAVAAGGGAEAAAAAGGAAEGMTKEEVEFIRLLEAELEKFNFFFVEKEEEYIIKLKELQDRMGKAKDSNEEMMKIRKEIVDFHGEMVLLENYSALNYTGLVKILKKYDKRTGALIRLPFIQRVLQQPFFTTDMIYMLVKECEKMIDQLFPANDPPPPSAEEPRTDDSSLDPTTSASTNTDGVLRVPKDLAEIEHMKGLYMKSTISALRVLKEIRSKSSTVSVFSLPPLQLSGVEEAWKKVPLREQEAK